MPNTEKSVEQPPADSSVISAEMLAALRRDSLYKIEPWRQQADKYNQRHEMLNARAKNPETRALLQQTFVEKMKSNNPFSQEVSFILMTLLYSGTSHPHIVLADMLLNMSAEERPATHNWWAHKNANELIKDSMTTAVASGNLIFPLFPGKQMDTQNRCMMEEAVEVKRPADRGASTMEALQLLYPKSRAYFAQSPPATKVLSGGEPFIPVYDGNNNQAGYWDGAPVKDRFDELYMEIQNLRSEFKSARALTNNGGGRYAGRGRVNNRRGRGGGNAQRGGRLTGRGSVHNCRMCGGEADGNYEEAYLTHKTNAKN